MISFFIFVAYKLNALGIHIFDRAALGSRDYPTRAQGRWTLHAGTYQRYLRFDQGNSLALHISPHQGPAGIIVLDERDQGSRDA